MTMQMTTQRYEPLSLFGACYVLELAGGRVYIGWSRNLSNRLSEHWAGSGSIMTRTYPPVRVLQVVFPADYTVENNLTKHYAKCRGWEKADGSPNVRGGDYSALESRNPTRPGSATSDIELRGKAPPAEHERPKPGCR